MSNRRDSEGHGDSFSFEVTATDLCGRAGRLTVGGRSVTTPCLLPVVHPVNQIIPASELWSMGFEAVMTNSMILRRRAGDEARARGVRSILGYDGVVMTDSGGYQALEYGNVDVTFKEIAEFEVEIGSDFAVTLDLPTGASGSREYAQKTVEYSLRNALDTLRAFPDGRTVWVGPIQGGLFRDLLSRATSELVEAGFRFLALGSPTEVMENYRFVDLVRMISTVRKKAPYATPLHLFGAGHPLTMALSIALGCDTFDSASYILFARQERYMTERGATELRRMQYLPCSCPVCRATSVVDLLSMERGERVKRIARHNLHLLYKELMVCREAVAEGRLWDLVEERAAAHPSVTDAFHEIAKQVDLMKAGTSFMKERGLFLRSEADSQRPELTLASRRLRSVRRKRGTTGLLILLRGLPNEKFLTAKGTRSDQAGSVDFYRLHPRLGPYPAELDFLYPFTQTVDLRETSDESVTASDAIEVLRRMGYKRILTATMRGGRLRVSKRENR